MSSSGAAPLDVEDLESLRQRVLARKLPLAVSDPVDEPARRVSYDSLRPVRSDIAWTAHYAEAVFRNQTLLNALSHAAKSTSLLVLTRSWAETSVPVRRERWLDHFLPATYWFSRQFGESDISDPEPWEHLYLAEVDLASPAISAMLVLEANDQAMEPMIFDRSMTWAFSPCDEGGHVFARSVEDADAFRAEYSEWLTPPIERGIARAAQDTAAEPLQWELDMFGIPEPNVRRLRELAIENNLIPDDASLEIVDPHRSLRVHLSRASARLLRILITGRGESVFRWSGSTPEWIDQMRAGEILLRPEEGESLLGVIEDFVEEDSYRGPDEAEGGVLDLRWRDPSLNYDGIGEPQ